MRVVLGFAGVLVAAHLPLAASAQSDQMLQDTERALGQILGTAEPQTRVVATEAELRQLSDDIVVSIVGTSDADISTADLKAQLEELVAQARASGKSDDYLSALIQEASEGQLENVPNDLKTEDDQIDAAALLRSVVTESAPQSEETSQSAAGGEAIHVVAPGESLSIIARKVYGNPFLFRRIFEANLDRIADPNVIRVGQRLIIPN